MAKRIQVYAFICFISILLSSLRARELPNILWITSEDNGPHLGCYGDSYATTPNLDKFATKSLRFTNASSNGPVCAVARTTLITGMYATSTGGHHMRSFTPLPSHIKMYPEFLKEAGYFCINNVKEDFNLSVEENDKIWDLRSKKADWRDAPDDQPFFTIINLTISHESKLRNKIEPENQIHDPAAVKIPAYHPDIPESRKEWAQYYDRITMMDTEVGEILQRLEEDGLEEDTIVFYYSDHGSGMPRSKRWPYRSGLNIPLITYFPEKWIHLAPEGYAPGAVSDRLVSFVDFAPTLLSITGQKAPEWMQGQAFAGEKQTFGDPVYSFGYRSRMDERYDEVRTVMGKRYIYLRHYMPHRIYGQYLSYMFNTKTTSRWREMFDAGALNAAQSRFWQEKPAEELYDYLADPDETINLVDSENPDHQAALKAMRIAHRDWLIRTHDLGFIPEGELERRINSENTTAFAFAQSSEAYPLETIVDAAMTASSRDSADLPEIIKLTEHGNSMVRYWAATGLLIHKGKAYQLAKKELEALINDPSPSVAIVAAESLAKFGQDEERDIALKKLYHYADYRNSSYYDAVFAMNALDNASTHVGLDPLAIANLPDEAPVIQRIHLYLKRLKECL